MRSHEKQALSIMLLAFKNNYFHFLPQGCMGSGISDKDRALNNAALDHLYGTGLGTPSSSAYDFRLTNDGAEYLEELKLIENDELTTAGSTILLLASPPQFRPPMKETAPVVLAAIRNELLEKPELNQLVNSMQWSESNGLTDYDYEKVNVLLRKQFRKLYDAYIDQLDIPEAKTNAVYEPSVSMHIGSFHNYGVMNAGTMSDIESITLNINSLKEQNSALGESIKTLTDSVQATEMPEEFKERAIDSINELTTEIAKPNDLRRPWKVKEKLEKLTALFGATTAAFEGYEKLKPHVDALIQIVKSVAGFNG